MVGRPGKFQPRFTSGELDELIQQNTDEKIYQTGASQFVNVRPLPQGGFTARDGYRKRDRLRGVLAGVSTAGAGVTAPAGGTGANLIDGDNLTYLTTSGVTAANTTVAVVTFAAPVTLSAVDLELFAGGLASGEHPQSAPPSAPTGISGTGQLFWNNGAGFVGLDGPFAISDTLRWRRLTPGGPGATIVTNQLLLQVTLTPSGTLFWISEMSFHIDSGALSAARVRSFTYDLANAYDMVFTDGNIEIYDATQRVASIATPYASAQIARVKNVQQLDTMLAFLQETPPLEFSRLGTSVEWSLSAVPFRNIPNYDFGDVVYGNAVPAQWQIDFFNFDAGTTSIPLPTGGASYTISVNGVASPAIQQPGGGVWTGTAAALEAAILAIPGVNPGVTVVQDGATPSKFTITFTGSGNEGDGWAVSGLAIDKSDAAITAAHLTVGLLGGEPILSPSRGYPGCGVFYGGRLLLGGFKGVPNAVLCSESGDYFNLDTRLVAASAPFLIPIDTDGAATILDLHKGRTLDIFTDAGEYWLSGAALDRTVTPVIVLATTEGIAPTVTPAENEGSTIFCGSMGGALFEFKFDYSEQNYTSSNMSVESSSLVKGVVDNCIRRLTGSTDVNELYAIRGDGLGFMVNLLREQEITSYARITTDGSLLAVNVNGRFEVSYATQRQLAGAPAQFLERVESGLLLDCAEDHAVAGDGVTVSGLASFEGVEVWAVVAGYVQGPYTISGGALTLGFSMPAGTTATVGRWTPPVVATLPQPRDVAPRTVVRRPARVHTVRLTVVNTTSVAIGANGGPLYDVPIYRLDGPADVAPLNAPYTGHLVMEGLQGFSEDAIVVISQLRPGLLTVTGVTVEVDL